MEDWFEAAANNHVQHIKQNMPQFARMTNETDKCKTALMISAQNGNLEIVHLLAESECLMKASNGFTALMYATAAGNIECVHILAPLEANQRSLESEKAIEIAARKERVDAFKILWQYEGEASIEIHDNHEIRCYYDDKTRKSAAQRLSKSQLLWYYMPNQTTMKIQLLKANTMYSKQLQVLRFQKAEYLKIIEVMNQLSRNDESDPEEVESREYHVCERHSMMRNQSAVYLGSLSKNLSFEELERSGIQREQKMRNIVILVHGIHTQIAELREDAELLLTEFEAVFSKPRH